MKKGNKKIITRILKIISLFLVTVLLCGILTNNTLINDLPIIPLPSATPIKTYESEHEYIFLKDKLEQVLLQKSYDDEVKEILRDTLIEAYTNYPIFKKIFAIEEVPSVTEYLTDNFIDLLDKNIDIIKIFFSFEELSEMIGYNINDSAGIYIEKDRAIYIRDGYERFNTLMHEIYHSSQNNMDDGNFSGYEFFGTSFNHIFSEGGAEKGSEVVVIVQNYNLYSPCAFTAPNNDTFQFVIARRGSSYNYTYYYCIYEKIQLMAGYKATEQYKTDGNIAALVNTIDDKYGMGTMEKLVKSAESLYAKIYNLNLRECFEMSNGKPLPYSYEEYKEMLNLAVEMENIVLRCLESIISKAVSKEEIIDFLNYYRHYKLMYSIQLLEKPERALYSWYEINIRDIDHTGELTNMFQVVEEALIDKIITYNVLPDFSINEIKELMSEKSFSRTKNEYPLKLF